MLTTQDRADAYQLAESIANGGAVGERVRTLALAHVEGIEREVKLHERIAELTDTVERITRSGVENATRYAADLAAERRAGAAAVERIREALVYGTSDIATRTAADHAFTILHNGEMKRLDPRAWALCTALLALSASHAEARALLSDISARARELLGKGGT